MSPGRLADTSVLNRRVEVLRCSGESLGAGTGPVQPFTGGGHLGAYVLHMCVLCIIEALGEKGIQCF